MYIHTYMYTQGSVKLLKGSVASSSREKRNARKRSFEQSLSATAAKILKMEQEKDKTAGEKVRWANRYTCTCRSGIVLVHVTCVSVFC